MAIYLITGVVVVALIASMWRDNRSLWNPALLIIAVFFGYLSVVQAVYQSGSEAGHLLVLMIGFLGVPFVIFLSGFFFIYNGIVLLKREGKSKSNFLSLGMGFLILLFFGVIIIRALNNQYFYENHWLNIFLIFFIYSYVIFGFAFFGFLFYSILYVFIPKRKQYDFIIIHGAGLLDGERVTPLLKRRIDKAVEAFKKSKNPNIKLIASGGKGADEKISEAQAILNYLMEETDVPRESVLLEEESRTTYENLLFSKRLGETFLKEPRNERLSCLSNQYLRQDDWHARGWAWLYNGELLYSFCFHPGVCGSLCENEMDVCRVLPASGNGDYTLLQRNFMVIVKLL